MIRTKYGLLPIFLGQSWFNYTKSLLSVAFVATFGSIRAEKARARDYAFIILHAASIALEEIITAGDIVLLLIAGIVVVDYRDLKRRVNW